MLNRRNFNAGIMAMPYILTNKYSYDQSQRYDYILKLRWDGLLHICALSRTVAIYSSGLFMELDPLDMKAGILKDHMVRYYRDKYSNRHAQVCWRTLNYMSDHEEKDTDIRLWSVADYDIEDTFAMIEFSKHDGVHCSFKYYTNSLGKSISQLDKITTRIIDPSLCIIQKHIESAVDINSVGIVMISKNKFIELTQD